ncbi:glycosyltransferase family 2 protein [bacterium]|nr:glycosyltransferase family 2 protein [bacterium]
MKITCVIPAYNEAANISRVINKVKPFVSEIIVIDDASQDDTSQVAQKEEVVVLRHIVNRGQGAALRTGTNLALARGADIIVHFDADDQFQATDIPKMIAPIISKEADAVLGSRFLTKDTKLPKMKRYFIMPLARLINRWFFNIRLTDPQSGFRALSRKSAEKLTIDNDGMAHCSEILYKLFQNQNRLQEVPITVVYHEYGQKFSGGLKIIKDLLIQKLIK